MSRRRRPAAKLSIAVQTFERMRAEIAGMGARTPHELMRAVEVSFIRDCAEMAARVVADPHRIALGPLPRPRRPARPRRRRSGAITSTCARRADGSMEFLKRPGGTVFRPGARSSTTCRRPTRRSCPVEQPPLVGGQAPATDARPASPRPRGIRAAVAAHRRGAGARGADHRRPGGPTWPTPIPGCGAPRWHVSPSTLRDGYAPALLARAGRRATPRCAAPRPTVSASSSRCCPIRRRCGHISTQAIRWCAAAAIYVLSCAARRATPRSTAAR